MTEPIVRVVGWTLLHSLWQGAVVALVAASLLAVLPRAVAAIRYRILCAALFLHVAAPAVTATVLVSREGGVVSTAAALAATGGAVDAQGAARPAVAAPVQVTLSARLERVLPLFVVFWLSGTLVGGVRVVGGWMVIRRLIRRARPAAPPLAERARRLAGRLGIGRAVRVLVSGEVAGPFAARWLRPAIVLPLSLLGGFSPAHLDAILAHELAHVRRLDYLVGLLQSLAVTLLFHHPATRWLDRRLRAEREHCCDDVVVDTLGDRLGYARALAELESRRLGLPSLALAATDGSLHERIERLLGVPSRAPVSGWIPIFALVALLCAAGVAYARKADPAAPLAARWEWSVVEGREPVVVGWSIRSRINDGTVVVSSTDGSSRKSGPRVAELVSDVDDGVAIFVTWSGDEIVAVRLRSLGASISLDGQRLHWLGAVSDADSIALLERLLAQTKSGRMRSELGAALSLHDDGPRVRQAVERVMASDPDARVRGETLSWLGRHAHQPWARALVRRGIADRSLLVRDEALSVLFSDAQTAELIAILRTSKHADVRAEIVQRLDPTDEAAVAELARAAADDPSIEVRSEAADALEKLR